MTAQCGRLTRVNHVACNGIIHTVDRVLIPPDMDIAELLRTQSDLSVLNRLIAVCSYSECLLNYFIIMPAGFLLSSSVMVVRVIEFYVERKMT